MAKVRDYHKLALDIINFEGANQNILNAKRCSTTQRLVI